MGSSAHMMPKGRQPRNTNYCEPSSFLLDPARRTAHSFARPCVPIIETMVSVFTYLGNYLITQQSRTVHSCSIHAKERDRARTPMPRRAGGEKWFFII